LGTVGACGGYTADASPAPHRAARANAAHASAHARPTAPVGDEGPSASTVAAITSSGMPPLPAMGKVVLPGAVTRSARTAPSGARRGVAVFGDSLTLQAWAYLQRIAADRGQPFDGGAYGGTALCDWLGGIHKALSRDHPAALVLAFAGNNLTPCTLGPTGKRRFGADLVTRYRADTQRAIADAARAHTQVFLVGPAAMRDPAWDDDAARLRTMLRTLAAHHGGVEYLDAHAALSPNGFQPARPCLPFETAALGCHDRSIVERADDGVHLSAPVGGNGGYSAGGWRFATLLLRGLPNAG
jgi:GDSL-like lipase/acylhydrolase family protein